MTQAAPSASFLRCSRRDDAARTVNEIRAEYARIAAAHARGEESKHRLPLADARANALAAQLVGRLSCRRRRASLGTHRLADIPLAELIDFIDWTPFFATWELKGKFPAILDDPQAGEAARSLFADAQEMLQRSVTEGWFHGAAP